MEISREEQDRIIFGSPFDDERPDQDAMGTEPTDAEIDAWADDGLVWDLVTHQYVYKSRGSVCE